MIILLLSNQVHASVINTSKHQERLTEMVFHTVLKKAMECMGIQELKPKQIELIESFVSGRETFVSLPTGYGKSIILSSII